MEVQLVRLYIYIYTYVYVTVHDVSDLVRGILAYLVCMYACILHLYLCTFFFFLELLDILGLNNFVDCNYVCIEVGYFLLLQF